MTVGEVIDQLLNLSGARSPQDMEIVFATGPSDPELELVSVYEEGGKIYVDLEPTV